MANEIGLSGILVIDALRLRRASTVQFLSPWAIERGLRITSASPNGLPSELETRADTRLVVLNIGSQCIGEPDVGRLVGNLLSLLSDVPLVVLGDSEEAAQIIGAFRAGASGYVPSSSEPSLAMAALTFILSGGTYFPPNALLSSSDGGERIPVRLPRQGRRDESSGGSLTSRQIDVATLLKQGLPNKVIARQLQMTEATVKVHVRQIMRKLGAANRTQAALCASTTTSVSRSDDPVDTLMSAPKATGATFVTISSRSS